jgi:Druantia protein DruA
VAEPILIQGRWWTSAQIEAIRQLIAENPGWSRRRLSVALSEHFAWRTATGQLRDMAARHLLNKLAARQWIELPARQRRGGKRRLGVLENESPDLFSAPEAAPIVQSLESLRPLEIVLAEPRQAAATDFVRHLARHHYLGFGGDTGATLRYVVRDRHGRDLACALFGAAAWQVRAREAFIGWNRAQRREHLGEVVNNTRFLILPHVQVAHLASHILGRLLRRLARDWQRKYAIAPCLVETFVERGRFVGVCYRAANWQCVGQSCGRSRADRDHRLQVPLKDIYLYPLRPDFRQRLCT